MDAKSQYEVIKAWLSKGDNTCDCRCKKHRESLVRMLTALWDRQTYDEQATHTTRKVNYVGFNAFDAKTAGWMMEKVREGDLPEKIAWKAKFMLKKYARQLAEVKESKQCAQAM